MKNTNLEEIRRQIAELAAQVKQLRLEQQLADGIPVPENDKKEFNRRKQQQELDEVQKMIDFGRENSQYHASSVRSDFGNVQNPVRVENRKND